MPRTIHDIERLNHMLEQSKSSVHLQCIPVIAESNFNRIIETVKKKIVLKNIARENLPFIENKLSSREVSSVARARVLPELLDVVKCYTLQ